MTEFELNNLKDLPTPAPSARAKAAALNAAREAFAEKTEATTKTDNSTQGTTEPRRHTHKTSKPKRKSLMHMMTRPGYAIAATLLITAVSIPALMLYMREAPQSKLYGNLRSESESRGGLMGMLSNQPKKQDATKRTLFRKTENSPPAAYDRLAVGKINKQPGRRTDDRMAPATSKPVKPASAPPSTVATGEAFVDGLAGSGRVIAMQELKAKPRNRLVAGLAGERNKVRVSPRRAGKDRLAYNIPAGKTLSLTVDKDGNVVKPSFVGRDQFETVNDNPLKQVATAPVSTFSVDVDTAAYAFVRRALNAGRLPQKSAVRVEELINYFSYDYATPETRDMPFQPNVTVLPSPWNAQNKLVHIGIKGYALNATERPRANLVFLIDVSGSMQGPDRLQLLKNSFRLLVDNLKPDDTIGIVTYAGRSGIALPATKISDKSKILAAIAALGAGGSTAGAQGIRTAYQLAEANFDKEAVNRIILATDGDFNVGISNRNELKSYIERKRKSGIFLSILGVGRGNYNDALMQTLAQNGNGTAAYIDTLNEARKVLVTEASSTLFPIAKDVKIQIEFNPARVKSYRLIGYETRALKREDFNNDKVDAGEVGSGHTVTAIYEITPVGATNKLVDDLRYAKPDAKPAAAIDPNGEFGFLKLRYKRPNEDKSRQIQLPITPAMARSSIDATSADVRFSTAVAAFGQKLRGSSALGNHSYDDIIALAGSAKGPDPFGIRAEFVNLVRLAKSARP